MKTPVTQRHLLSPLLACILAPMSLSALEVHEWGTFTVFCSSRGTPARWYQPWSDLAKLPSFTHSAMILGKSGPATVRMETPVLYFYPKQETKITVGVRFEQGTITERFPAAGSVFASKHTVWSGTLLPPDSADAKRIPVVTVTDGENYAAAREVPDAWLFRSDQATRRIEGQPDVHQVEKFIFYRGAGEAVPPMSMAMPDDKTVNVTNAGERASLFQIALRVAGGKASWVKLPTVPPDSTISHPFVSSAELSKTAVTPRQADRELSALFYGELTARGLTDAEAKAMIATWNHTWFGEPGQRVFTIVDPAWVDQVLPLDITPKPQTIRRVFVARYEMMSPATEKMLSDLLCDDCTVPKPKDLAQFQLGRFAMGAATLVAEQKQRAMMDRYYAIVAAQGGQKQSED